MNILLNYKGKTITYDEILKLYPELTYEQLCEKISFIEGQNILVGKVTLGFNGREPKLYKKYRIVRPEEDFTKEIEEIKSFNAYLSINYYLNKPREYEKNRGRILKLNEYLTYCNEKLVTPMSINERSYDIWGDEKFLKKDSTKTLLNNLSLSLEKLNIYNTPEPFFYYINDKSINNILIIENKDTWFTIRRILKENPRKIFGYDIGLLIYGEGKKIISSIDFLNEKELSFLDNPSIKYWGDIDYEGINIYYLLNAKIKVDIFTEAYEEMLQKVNDINSLKETKENQKTIRDLDLFLSYFNNDDKEKITKLLISRKYIPQEIVNYNTIL